MKMKNKILHINKDKIKRKEYLKKEIKKIVLLSIIQNLNLKPVTRALALKKITHFKRYAYLSKQNNNICLKTGRSKGVIRLTNFSRHYMKQLSLTGSLQNI